MTQEAVVIPDKIYFKIGEVCELVGVQAHVLRYWETEFSVLSPQKNKSGQRSYRRRDVEIALRVRQLLYNEMFTIAGARKKIQAEMREGSKARSTQPAAAAPVPSPRPAPRPLSGIAERPGAAFGPTGAPLLFDAGFVSDISEPPDAVVDASLSASVELLSSQHRDTLQLIRTQLTDLRRMLQRR